MEPTQEFGDITKGGTFLLPMRRERLLHFLPKRARVAEIGVAQGNFSREIFFRTFPRRLALIDCWEMIDNSDRDDDADIPQSLQNRRHRGCGGFSNRLAFSVISM